MINPVGKQIPVILGQPRSGAGMGFTCQPPLTPVHVFASSSWRDDDDSPPLHNGKSYLALIDTGTDSTAVDQAVAHDIDAILEGNGVAHGMGGSVAGIKRARIQILFPSINLTFCSPDAAVLDFRASGQPFDLILGRSFLRHCLLSVDGPNSADRLSWLG